MAFTGSGIATLTGAAAKLKARQDTAAQQKAEEAKKVPKNVKIVLANLLELSRLQELQLSETWSGRGYPKG
jgi:hypothetical protein